MAKTAKDPNKKKASKEKKMIAKKEEHKERPLTPGEALIAQKVWLHTQMLNAELEKVEAEKRAIEFKRQIAELEQKQMLASAGLSKAQRKEDGTFVTYE